MFSEGRRLTFTALALLVAVIVLQPVASVAQNATAPEATRAYSTIYSIGVEWDVFGDANHNAAVQVQYRVQGTSTWEQGMPLIRVDNTSQPNGFAGSLFFLTPDTTYEVLLALSDPDGGAESRTLTVTTRPLPALPTGGRALHVVPGSGGGDGSSGNPFQGITAAQAAAQPGDILLLHAGTYGGRTLFNKSGGVRTYIVWKAAGDGEVLLSGGFNVAADHVWIEGVTVRGQQDAMLTTSCPHDVVLSRSFFYGNDNSIYLQQGGEGWYIADNTIVGTTPVTSGSLSGEGIQLNNGNLLDIGGGCPGSPNHTVAHNSVTNVADALDNPGPNTDIFGNDFFSYSDDGLENDSAGPNLRAWGNRLSNGLHSMLSFQPQRGAPWYFIRNQFISSQERMIKFVGQHVPPGTDRFVLWHNTFVNWSTMIPCCIDRQDFLNATSRNNLFISVTGGELWSNDDGSVVSWRTDLDYDGYDWGLHATPFHYGTNLYPDLPSLWAASGQERHGIRVDHTTCFETLDVPSPSPATVPPQFLTLKAGCNAIDAGVALPSINDGFFGTAPDLGAYETGAPLPVYGPRTASPDPPPAPLADTTPPVISGVATSVLTSSSATIVWTTNETSDTQVEYGLTTAYGAATALATSLVTSHLQTLSGLTASTVYHYRVKSRDAAGNLATSDDFTFTTLPPAGTRSPYKGSPLPVPGRIEAEDFDNGGEGVAYHDLTVGNQGALYRLDVDVDIYSPASGVYAVNNFQTGEWLTYTINVTASGTYRLEALVSNANWTPTPQWHAEIDGVGVTGPVLVPSTGSWSTYQWVGVNGVSLTAGQHILKLVADQQYFNVNAMQISATSSDTTLPTVALAAPAAGATVTGTITVSASASDNVGVVGVQFKLDGANLGAEVTTTAYSVSWNTTTALNGAHTLTAVARDAAGNVRTSAAVSVTVANDVTAPVISGVTASSVTSSGATISWTTNEASDTQVEYGRTTAYGTTTSLTTSLVTLHSQALSGLAQNTVYHYRVKSRDAAGNLAASGDFTFKTKRR